MADNWIRNSSTGAVTQVGAPQQARAGGTGGQAGPETPEPMRELPKAPTLDFSQASGDRGGFGSLLKVMGQAPLAAQYASQAANARFQSAQEQRNADRVMTGYDQRLRNKQLNLQDSYNQMIGGMHKQQMDEQRLATQREFNDRQTGTHAKILGPEAQGITDPVAAKRYSDYERLNNPHLQNATPQQMQEAAPQVAQRFGLKEIVNRGAILPGTTTRQDATSPMDVQRTNIRPLDWNQDVHRDPSGNRHWYNAFMPTVWGDKDEMGMIPYAARKVGGALGMHGVDLVDEWADKTGRIRQNTLHNATMGAPGYGSGGGLDMNNTIKNRTPVTTAPGSPVVDGRGEVQYPTPPADREVYRPVGSGY